MQQEDDDWGGLNEAAEWLRQMRRWPRPIDSARAYVGAVRTATGIQCDGRLLEPLWRVAPVAPSERSVIDEWLAFWRAAVARPSAVGSPYNPRPVDVARAWRAGWAAWDVLRHGPWLHHALGAGRRRTLALLRIGWGAHYTLSIPQLCTADLRRLARLPRWAQRALLGWGGDWHSGRVDWQYVADLLAVIRPLRARLEAGRVCAAEWAEWATAPECDQWRRGVDPGLVPGLVDDHRRTWVIAWDEAIRQRAAVERAGAGQRHGGRWDLDWEPEDPAPKIQHQLLRETVEAWLREPWVIFCCLDRLGLPYVIVELGGRSSTWARIEWARYRPGIDPRQIPAALDHAARIGDLHQERIDGWDLPPAPRRLGDIMIYVSRGGAHRQEGDPMVERWRDLVGYEPESVQITPPHRVRARIERAFSADPDWYGLRDLPAVVSRDDTTTATTTTPDRWSDLEW